MTVPRTLHYLLYTPWSSHNHGALIDGSPTFTVNTNMWIRVFSLNPDQDPSIRTRSKVMPEEHVVKDPSEELHSMSKKSCPIFMVYSIHKNGKDGMYFFKKKNLYIFR